MVDFTYTPDVQVHTHMNSDVLYINIRSYLIPGCTER